MVRGQCLCGTVTFEVHLPNDHLGDTRYCYCTACRRANGSVFSANVAVPEDHYTLLSGADAITEYESSPGTKRAFCSTCGSPVYGKKDSQPDHVRIRLGTLDNNANATPTAHVWVSEKPEWFKITDYLKRSKRAFEDKKKPGAA